jgi:methylglyoxal synthase
MQLTKKRIALVAHDNKKQDLLEWARFNRESLAQHEVFATGTTGKLLERELGLQVTKLQSGPLVFFWDPLEPLPHDPDIKALLRIAVVWNIPVACNRASADYIFSSPLMSQEYVPSLPDYEQYKKRRIAAGGEG